MRIGILGTGGVGSVLAGFLAQAHPEDVVVVARGEHLQAIRAHGLTVDGLAQAHGKPVAVEHGSELEAIDLLLLATKTFSTTQALADVDPRQVRTVASLQNGVLKDELLERHFGPDRVVGCTTMLGGHRSTPGAVRYMFDGDTFFGERNGEVTPRVLDIARAFSTAGLRVQTTRRIVSLEWTKQVLQAANAPLSALLRMPVHLLYRGPAARLYFRIVLEAAAVAGSRGVQLDDEQTWGGPIKELLLLDETEALEVIHAFAERLEARGATNIKVSMLQDVEAGRRTEIDETAGHVVDLAVAKRIPTPYLDFACQAVRALSGR